MKHYVVVELEVTDPSWVAAYVENVTKLIELRRGRYLAHFPTFRNSKAIGRLLRLW
jgi:uncharacterized protein (DUF1330 family)